MGKQGQSLSPETGGRTRRFIAPHFLRDAKKDPTGHATGGSAREAAESTGRRNGLAGSSGRGRGDAARGGEGFDEPGAGRGGRGAEEPGEIVVEGGEDAAGRREPGVEYVGVPGREDVAVTGEAARGGEEQAGTSPGAGRRWGGGRRRRCGRWRKRAGRGRRRAGPAAGQERERRRAVFPASRGR